MIKYTKRSDGRYQTKVYLGTEDGKGKYKYLYAPTVAELQRKADSARYALHRGGDIMSGDLPFETWGQRFLQLKEGKLSAVYYQGLEGRVRWWCEAVGSIPISKVCRSDMQVALDRLAAWNPQRQRPTSKRTLNEYRRTAADIFDLAISDRAIDYNPAQKLEVSPKAPQQQRRALTDEEQQWILEMPHRAQLPAVIMMLAGLRRGEVLALQAKDIDFLAKTISVNKSVSMVEGKPVVKPGGKTAAATRVVDMPRQLVDFLRPVVSGLSPFDVLCTDAHGRPYTASGWKRLWESYLRDLNFQYGRFTQRPTSKFDPDGVPFVICRITPHMLRHTAATNLILAGVDAVTVKAQLGHSSIQTTLDIYTHVTQEHRQTQIQKLDDFLASRGAG